MLSRFVRTTIAVGRRSFLTETISSEPTTAAAAAAATTTAAAATTTTTKSGSTIVGGRDTLGRRLLSLAYVKRSAVITIRKWIEEGKTIQKYELNRVVRELRRLKRYKHALEICEWMTLQQDMKLLPGDYAVHLDLIAKVRGLPSAEKFFEDLPKGMVGQPTCSALLHSYVQNKLSDKAETVMKKMAECGFLNSPLPYNHMLSLYISTEQLDKVPDTIQALKKNTSPDVVTYNLWFTYCAPQNNVGDVEKILLEMKKAKVEPDWVTCSTLSNFYMKNGLHEKAAAALKVMEKSVGKKSRVAYPSIITLHANMGDKDGVLRTWNKMKSSFRKMNDAEYTSMISSLLKVGEFEEAEKIYNEWESSSRTGDSRVSNLLLAVYINKGQMEKAESFCKQMVQKGVKPSYTTMELLTWGYLKTNEMGKVLDYLKKAIESVKKWKPDDGIVSEVLKNLEKEGDVERAEEFLVILRNAGHVTSEIYNSLLRTYEKAGKMPLIVAERMEKDKVTSDEETHRLIKLTGKLCVGDVSNVLP